MPDDAFFPDLFVSRDEITRDEIAAYQSALDTARDEADMQHCLEVNPRMLIQHLTRQCAWVVPQKRLGSEHVTDFVIAQEASGGLVWYAVELERPQAKMFNKNGDPSAVLNHALRQIKRLAGLAFPEPRLCSQAARAIRSWPHRYRPGA